MTPAGIIAALAEHGARIAVEGDRVRLLFPPGSPPPADLVEAARQHKAALRVLVVAPAAPQAGALDLSAILPAHVAAGLDQLAAGLPLLDDWPRRIEAARDLAARWHAQACRLGWTDLDLYGLHPIAPAARYAAKGLAWSLGKGERVIALTADAATVERQGGNGPRYYRARGDTGAVLAWSLPLAAQRAAQ